MRYPMAQVCGALACVALLAPGAAFAQDPVPPADEPAADEAPVETEPGDPPPPDDGAEGEPLPDTTTEGTDEAPAEEDETTEVVLDDRAAALQREQVAMEDEAETEANDPSLDNEPGELSHLYQVGLRVGVGVPFFFGIAYGGGAPCNNSYRGAGGMEVEADTFCPLVGSTFLDFDVSFGVTTDLEITAMFRYGVFPTEPTEESQLIAGLGIRSLLMPEDVFKLFLGARVILDFTPEGVLATSSFAGDWGDVDLGVRGEFGLQVDVFRYMGIYAQIGVNILFLRAFGIWGDAQAGLQARFP